MDSLHQDKSGYICSKEFGSLLRTLGYNPTEAEVNSLMAKVDVDHNGKVFIYLMFDHFQVVVDIASLSYPDQERSAPYFSSIQSWKKQNKYWITDQRRMSRQIFVWFSISAS